MPVISALERLRQVDCELRTSLDNTARPSSPKKGVNTIEMNLGSLMLSERSQT